MFTKEQEQNQKKFAHAIIDNYPLGAINWYPFINNDSTIKVLHISRDCNGSDIIEKYFKGKGFSVTSMYFEQIDISEYNDNKYDYIICIGIIEYCKQPIHLLKFLKKHLKRAGNLLLGTENRLGLRYFCGDRDPFTRCNFDGIEGYSHLDYKDLLKLHGRCYSKSELMQMIESSGLFCSQCYSIYPSLNAPQLIYREDTYPNEEISARYFSDYYSPETIFLQENLVLQSISNSSLFHEMANAFLFEIFSEDVNSSNIRSVTLTMDRGWKYDFATCITDSEVIKKPLYPEGFQHLSDMVSFQKALCDHDVNVVSGKLQNDGYHMPFVTAENAVHYFQKLAKSDQALFFRELDRYIDIIKHSSAVSEFSVKNFLDKNGYGSMVNGSIEKQLGICLRYCYIDMVPLNCFVKDKQFLFYDQEFRYENYPLNVLIYRVIVVLSIPQISRYVSQDVMLKRYGLYETRDIWNSIANNFINKLRNKTQLGEYDYAHRADFETIGDNRLRINYSETEYENLFLNIFKDTDRLDVYVFGAGTYAAHFIDLYGSHLKIAGIIDNDRKKWGTIFHGIRVYPADVLQQKDPFSYKVIICMLKYQEAYKQSAALGAKHISIYYKHRSYELPWQYHFNTVSDNAVKSDSVESVKTKKASKKYNIGYVAGVFDLFHIGHLNLLRRAKEQCNYLIVGVVSDEQVRRAKKRDPAIPCTERMEIVRACRYVDEVFEIPIDLSGTRDIYNMYHFDVQFSGSDYAQDSSWLADKRYLESHGAELVFLPYTNGTSSTQIRERLIKG